MVFPHFSGHKERCIFVEKGTKENGNQKTVQNLRQGIQDKCS